MARPPAAAAIATKVILAQPVLAMTYPKTIQDINDRFESPYRNRMLAQLLEEQTLDAWMTHNLMHEAITWVENKELYGTKVKMINKMMTRDQDSSTSANILNLQGTDVDAFYNFQTIRLGGVGIAAMRHTNRPDGMFVLKLNADAKDMVLFYEGDAHSKDEGKSLTKGCKNSHKMYQAIAQAQSRNPEMAACVIFAAMLHASTNDALVFVDDMLKAHIFVCIAITDWNAYNKTKVNGRRETLIGNLFRNKLLHD
jgi:hypothetical protein